MSSFLYFIRSLFRRRWCGVYPAMVVSNQDPEALGRVRVSLPDPYGDGETHEEWARIATLMAGKNRGTWFIPDNGDEVLVAFEGGDPRRPYIVGALWNAESPPPEQMDAAGQNLVKSIHSRAGISISLYDLSDGETLSLKTPAGQSIVLRDEKGGSVEIQDANGNLISLSPEGVRVLSSAKVTVNASTLDISAGMVTVNSGMSTFSGVVKVDALIANSVVSASYSPH